MNPQPMNPRHALSRRLPIPVGMAAILAGTITVPATVLDFRNEVTAHPNLIHHYTFEGADNTERREDKEGSADLGEVFNSASAGPITYGAAGFDATTTSVITVGHPTASLARGFSTGSAITLPTTLTVEVLFRPDTTNLQTGRGYVVAARPSTPERGYFVYQGSTDADANDISTLIGDPYSSSQELTLVETLTVGHWYYVANTYTVSGGSTTITTHIADLTAGDTTLTTATKTVSGDYGSSGPLYIGIANFLGEGFPGAIDEVALYDDALDAATLEDHLLTLGAAADPTFDQDTVNGAPDLAFGIVLGSSAPVVATRTVRYVNNGAANNISVDSVTVTDDAGGVFSVSDLSDNGVGGQSAPVVLSPGEFIDITVESSAPAGAHTATLAIDTDVDIWDRTLPISGNFLIPGTTATIAFQHSASPDGSYSAPDTWIRADDTDANYPDYGQILVGSNDGAGPLRGLLQFDLTALSELNPESIHSAELVLYFELGQTRGLTSITVDLYQTDPFDATVATWADPDGDGDPGNDTDGGALTSLLQSLAVALPGTAGYRTFADSTAFRTAVADALASDSKTLALLMKDTTELTNNQRFVRWSSAENTIGAEYAPRLEISCTLGSGTDDYAAWAAGQSWTYPGPDTGPGDDFDRDGLTNDTERLFGLDPASGASASPAGAPPDPVAGTFTYTRRDPALTLAGYVYQYSTTLEDASWQTVTPAAADAIAAGPGAGNQTVTVDLDGATPDVLSNPTLFLRVVATGP